MNDEHDLPGPASLPGEPTDAPPGSELKIRIMTERASRREELFHPQDGARKKSRLRLVRLARMFCTEPESA
jgi:hypothetical protein